MASLRKRLQNLFSTNVIVRTYGKNKLKVVDTNRLQSVGNLAQSKLTDRYTRLHGSNKHKVGGVSYLFEDKSTKAPAIAQGSAWTYAAP